MFWHAVMIHWMNPMVWIAWHYFTRDLELACDERAVDHLNANQKSDYSQTLLNLAVQPKRMHCPVAFGNNSVKQRITHVLHYKGIPALARDIIVILLVVAAVFLAVNPLKAGPLSDFEPKLLEEYPYGLNSVNIQYGVVNVKLSDSEDTIMNSEKALAFRECLSNVKVQNVLPVGVNGAKNIINGSISTSLWYGDGVYLMFFIGNFAYKKYDDVKIILSYALTGLIVILFMIFFYAIFTSIAHRQTYSLTEISKYSTVINNIGRFDYIGIALILFSNMFASILPLFFTTLLISRAFKVKNKWPISLIVTGCLFFIITFLKEYFLSIDNFIFYYGNYAFLIAFNIIPLLSPLLTLKEKKYAPTKT
jgi:hypothetical protein